MENASKALLIAGAILICIVLISVGMIIVNSTTDVTDQVGELSSTQAAQSFNTQFSKYAGKQKGSSVKSLLETIASNNGTSNKKIMVSTPTLASSDDSSAISADMANVTNTSSYTVTISGMDANGFINAITITTP